jgi:glycosyltransferase involved in cell wall biosynthesis
MRTASRTRVRISVITATLNRERHLIRAIESVIAQGHNDVEHIIVDGASTDGTLDMLKAYPHLTVISEVDSGLYEAWNKGLRRATGDIICILNSDDEIPLGAFAHVCAAIAATPDLDLISGAVELGEPALGSGSGQVRRRLIDAAPILSLREQDVGPGIPITNGRYLTRRLVERVGLFDERYRLVSDRDYLLRVLLTRPRNVCIRAPLYRYLVHDLSLTLSGSSAVDRLARESLLAAQNGLLEAASPAEKAAFRRWHAWAAFYLSTLDARRGHKMQALATGVRGLRLDPLFPLRLPRQVWQHLRERALRAGRPIEG